MPALTPELATALKEGRDSAAGSWATADTQGSEMSVLPWCFLPGSCLDEPGAEAGKSW